MHQLLHNPKGLHAHRSYTTRQAYGIAWPLCSASWVWVDVVLLLEPNRDPEDSPLVFGVPPSVAASMLVLCRRPMLEQFLSKAINRGSVVVRPCPHSGGKFNSISKLN